MSNDTNSNDLNTQLIKLVEQLSARVEKLEQPAPQTTGLPGTAPPVANAPSFKAIFRSGSHVGDSAQPGSAKSAQLHQEYDEFVRNNLPRERF